MGIIFTAAFRSICYEVFSAQAAKRISGQDGDGSLELEVNFTSAMEIKPLIYYYLPCIKVLSSKWLADGD